MASGCEDDGVRDEHPAAAVVDVKPVTTEDAAVMDEQARDIDVVANRHTDLLGRRTSVRWISRPV
jgi:hypothetical protein